jgi:hypothetical protein
MTKSAIALNPSTSILVHLRLKKERSPLRQKERSPFITPPLFVVKKAIAFLKILAGFANKFILLLLSYRALA